MEQLYPLRKVLAVSILALMASAGIAQTSPCGPIVENFNSTGGSMAGFTSSTLLSSAPGFTFDQTGQNGYLQRCGIPSAGTTYFISSPTYQSLASQTSIGWGFTLSGEVEASLVSVFLQYIDNLGNINSVSLFTAVSPTYTGTGSNKQLVLCESAAISSITGFTAGEAYRIQIQITSETASNPANQCMVFDDFRTTGTVAQAPLPVTFIGFGAKKLHSGIELTWNVAGETNVQSYIVERSGNGRDFTKLGEVAASNSAAYTFVDPQPLNGMAYYRIKEVDVDGKFKYSTIVRLNLEMNSHLRAYPSPAKDLVTIEHAVIRKGTLSITTTDGRVVKQIDVKPELNQTVINISTLKAGLYVIRFVREGGQTESIKLIKE